MNLLIYFGLNLFNVKGQKTEDGRRKTEEIS